MSDRIPFADNQYLRQTVESNTAERLGKTWSSLARSCYNHKDFNKIPIVSSVNPPDSFTPQPPVIIPLKGGGSIAIGRHKISRDQTEDIVININAASHRLADKDDGKEFTSSVILSPFGSQYNADVRLSQQQSQYMTDDEQALLKGTKRFMALFDPEKDIDWSLLTEPSEPQTNVLQLAGFHPPQKPPATATTAVDSPI